MKFSRVVTSTYCLAPCPSAGLGLKSLLQASTPAGEGVGGDGDGQTGGQGQTASGVGLPGYQQEGHEGAKSGSEITAYQVVKKSSGHSIVLDIPGKAS